MKPFRPYILRFALLVIMSLSALAGYAAPSWLKVAAPPSEPVENVVSEKIDVRVADSNIILTLSEAAEVKVFTILGQLVARQKLEAGVWSLPISARGIYILKVGSATRRVTI